MKAIIAIAIVSLTFVIGGQCLFQEEENYNEDQKASKRDAAWNYYACKYRGNDKLEDKKDCRKYYDCKKKKIVSCPSNELFDTSKKKCQPKEKVDCKKRKIFDEDSSSSESKEDNKNAECLKKDGKFPHPEDCSQYYNCKAWKSKLVSCPKKNLFNPHKAKCEPENKVHCGSKKNPYDPDSETDFSCPKESGSFPYSSNCANYYTCEYNLARLRTCPKDELFDVKKHKCQRHDKVSCEDRKNPYDIEKKGNFVCPFSEGEFFHPYECNKYYLCRDSVPKLKTCASGERFDIGKQRCLKEKKVDCGERIMPIEEEFKCLKHDGNHSAEHDCSLYYSCTSGRPHLKSCPSQQLFDKEKGCQEADYVDCQSRFNPYEDESEVTNEVDFECPRPNGYYAHPDDCRSYYNCHNSIATLDSCPRGKMFDTLKKKCANENSVDCKRSINPLNINDLFDRFRYRYRWCPRARGSFHHFSHCGYYYNCWHGRPSFRRCFHGNFYDIFRRRCYQGSLVDCGGRETKDRDDYDNEGFTCPSSNGKYPDETNCGTFYECNRKKWTLKNCPKGKLFDAQRKRCEKHYKVDCGDRFDPEGNPEEREGFECPTSRGNYPDSEDCSRYYSCNKGKATLKACPTGQLYDVERGDCERSYRVDCGERPNKKNEEIDDNELICPIASGNHPHPTDCKKYYSCSNGLAREKKCRGGQLFDVTRGVCESDYRVDCGARVDDSSSSSSEENSSENQYKCPTSRGNHPHSDCTMYYHCSDKKHQLKKCPDGQLYDVIRRDCDRWDKVDCGSRKNFKDIKTTFKPTEEITEKTTIEDFSNIISEKYTKEIGFNNVTNQPDKKITTKNPTDSYSKITKDGFHTKQQETTTQQPFTREMTPSETGSSDITRDNIGTKEVGTNEPFSRGTTISDSEFSDFTRDNIGTNDGSTNGQFTRGSTASDSGLSDFTRDDIGTNDGRTNEPFTRGSTASDDSGSSDFTRDKIGTKGIGTNEPFTTESTASDSGLSDFTRDNIGTNDGRTNEPFTRGSTASDNSGSSEFTRDKIGTKGIGTNEPFITESTTSDSGLSDFTRDNIGTNDGRTKEPFTRGSTASDSELSDFTRVDISTEKLFTGGVSNKEISEETSTLLPVSSKILDKTTPKETISSIGISTNPSYDISDKIVTDSTVSHFITGDKMIFSTTSATVTKNEVTTESIKSTLIDITDKPEGILECPEPNGLFPHPNPHKWVHCSNWVPHIKDCPGNLVFDKKNKICNWSVSISQDIVPADTKKDCH